MTATDAANGGAAKRRRRADRWARVGAVLVAAIGLFIVFLPIAEHGQHWAVDPDEARTITSTAVESQFGGVTTTTIVRSKAGTTTTSVSRSPAPDTKVTLSSAEEKRSLLVRGFGSGGFFLFRLALVAAAALLAGAIIQRTWLARFAVEFPFVSFDDVAEAADSSTVAIAALRETVLQRMTDLKEQVAGTFETTGEKTGRALEDLDEQITKLDRRIAAIDECAARLSPWPRSGERASAQSTRR